MGLFSSIANKIFGNAKAAGRDPAAQQQPTDAGAPPAPGSVASATPAADSTPASQPAQPAQPTPAPGMTPPTGPASATGTAPTATAQAAEPVDVEAVLNEAAARNPQQLNWRTSIVDLLKLLDLDSSLAARKELAQELNYTGDTSDSAAMNIWLHKEVMRKLAENGGKVPADLRD